MRADDFKTIADVADQGIGMNDKVDFFNTKATVLYIKSDTYSYPACSTEGCNKKVTEDGDGWRCEKCDRSWPKPNHR
jgi:replication factor A1